MRLDASKGDYNWWVYHAEECCILRAVVWIDDETAQWWEHVLPLRAVGDEVVGRLQQARKIVFLHERKLAIINPVEDSDLAIARIKEKNIQVPEPIGELVEIEVRW